MESGITIQMTFRFVRAALVVKVQGRITVCPRATWILLELTDTSRELTRPVEKGEPCLSFYPFPWTLAMPFIQVALYICALCHWHSPPHAKTDNIRHSTLSLHALDCPAILTQTSYKKGKWKWAIILIEGALALAALKQWRPFWL